MIDHVPLITLGIPIYNASDLIERTLLSALNQTYPNIEYLFIDDKGDSMDIVRRVVAEHPRRSDVHIIDQIYNQGIGAARNAILDRASGEYLFTMDCDDTITVDCIEILYEKMMEHPVDFVAASFVRVDLEGNQYPGYQYEDTLVNGAGHPVAEYRYEKGKEIFVASWNKLYKKSFLDRYNIRCKVGHFNEDPWFTYQVILNSSSCRLLPNCTLFYTYNPLSVSGKSSSHGYSDKIAHQYVDIQKLKSIYIAPFIYESFYPDLLVDIMTMSIYHAYRIGMSFLLSHPLKRDLQNELLTRHFIFPPDRKGITIKYFLLCLFFTFPLWFKRGLINLTVRLQIKDKIRKWIHFKS